MRLTVLLIAYPFAKVGPDSVGGAEQILSALDRGLTEAGHCSVVVAQAGSQVAGTLVATPEPIGALTVEQRELTTRFHQQAIERAFERFAPDLLHFHGIDFLSYRVPGDLPALATLHLPLLWYPSELWVNERYTLQCVSEHQRSTAPSGVGPLPVIGNGVSIPPLEAAQKPAEGYALTLGRICPEKNFHAALDAGTMANVPVWIGGQVFPYPEHLEYFEQQILPRLSGLHRFLGPLDERCKQRMLAEARCLLLPSLAPETSSLVAMEALAAGTPVIAYRSGAIPEIVEDGVTGFLVNSAQEMADAIERLRDIDPKLCRTTAVQRFAVSRMVSDYFNLYERILMRDDPRREQPRYASSGIV